MAARGIFTRASLLAGASVLQFGVAFAQEGCGEALNLENADIRSVVDEIAIRTGKKFVLDPRVQGQVTIKSGPNGGLCADEAWELFQAALRVTGFTAAPINSDSYRVIPIQEGSRAAGPVNKGERGDTITAGAERLDGVIRIWVQDTGKGMALDQQARAFESFQSGDRRGAGLGLALVRSFVEMHGGWVAIQSEPGRGATVTCHIPAHAVQHAAE